MRIRKMMTESGLTSKLTGYIQKKEYACMPIVENLEESFVNQTGDGDFVRTICQSIQYSTHLREVERRSSQFSASSNSKLRVPWPAVEQVSRVGFLFSALQDPPVVCFQTNNKCLLLWDGLNMDLRFWNCSNNWRKHFENMDSTYSIHPLQSSLIHSL